jgi:hypothetical protein
LVLFFKKELLPFLPYPTLQAEAHEPLSTTPDITYSFEIAAGDATSIKTGSRH